MNTVDEAKLFAEKAQEFVNKVNARWEDIRKGTGMYAFTSITCDMRASRFREICMAGYHNAALPYLFEYIDSWKNYPTSCINNFKNDPKGLAMIIPYIDLTIYDTLIYTVRDNIKLTQALCIHHYHKLLKFSEGGTPEYPENPLARAFINNNKNKDVIKFLLDNYPKLMKNPNSGHDKLPMNIIVASTPEILEELIKFYGIEVIAGYRNVDYVPFNIPMRHNIFNMYEKDAAMMSVIKKSVHTDGDFEKFCEIHFCTQ